MNDTEQLMLRLHAELPAFQRKVDYAQQIIADALARPLPDGQTWYLAFSGGIDSCCVLDMLWRAGARIPVLWGDDGADFPQTLDFLAATEQRYGFHLKRLRCLDPWRSWCEEMGRPDLAADPEALSAWGNPQRWDATWRSLTKDAPAHGYGGVFLGLLGRRRKEGGESTTRWRVLHGGNRPLYQVASEGNSWHCSPLAMWTKRDSWAYLISRNLPYNPAYDVLAALGVPLESRRVAPATCFRVLQYGSGVWLRAGWPDLYNRLASTFPQLRAYS